jgi:3-hydroxy-9,10-secoandrosta-1,3,5(10)-triene-9,17-dione monooxygenase reductase component
MAPEAFRRALGRFASGVTLVTAPGGLALVVSSFMSVSLEPPLVAFGAGRASSTWHRMRGATRLGINVLPGWLSDVHARAAPGADRLAGLEVTTGADGVPRLRDAVAYLGVEVVEERPAGDHAIIVCRVVDTACTEAAPLVAWRGALQPLEAR